MKSVQDKQTVVRGKGGNDRQNRFPLQGGETGWCEIKFYCQNCTRFFLAICRRRTRSNCTSFRFDRRLEKITRKLAWRAERRVVFIRAVRGGQTRGQQAAILRLLSATQPPHQTARASPPSSHRVKTSQEVRWSGTCHRCAHERRPTVPQHFPSHRRPRPGGSSAAPRHPSHGSRSSINKSVSRRLPSRKDVMPELLPSIIVNIVIS